MEPCNQSCVVLLIEDPRPSIDAKLLLDFSIENIHVQVNRHGLVPNRNTMLELVLGQDYTGFKKHTMQLKERKYTQAPVLRQLMQE